MKTPQEIYLQSLISATDFLDRLDKLKGTPVYKQEIKNNINRLSKQMENYTKPLSLVWGIDDKEFYKVLDAQQAFVKAVSRMQLADYDIMLGVMRAYTTHKEELINFLQKINNGTN